MTPQDYNSRITFRLNRLERQRILDQARLEGITVTHLCKPAFKQAASKALHDTSRAQAHGDNLGDAKSHRPLASGWLLRNVGANTDSGLWASSSRSHARGGRDCREASAECPRNAVMFLMRSG